MSDLSRMIRVLMQGLVDRAGGVEAAAALIGARLGTDVSKGSISKRNAGHLSWPFDEIVALEEAVGDPCVSRWRARNLPEVEEGQCLMLAVSEAYRETGEAFGAAAALASGNGCRVQAGKEVSEAVASVEKLAALIKGSGK
ncbi:hypothetical protein [Paracoccus sp. IB05]|uniref:hypothetical protein n=1 Tax=Paracoccus sp. IB05 TaxID=2779367 RepID=UPI0018E85AED|nr:hypothetical protein [Paracoccus sp. IB05]MBJ2150655.1 hypothetical protein [Paracoccus sp. IB05]